MVSPEILDYVKKELARGISEGKLRQVLMEHGWPEFEVNEAFEKAKEAKPVERPEEKKEVTGEKPEEAKPEEKVKEAVEKPPVMDDVKKIITNKVFIIAAIVIILSSVALFVLPSLSENRGEAEGEAMKYAETVCRQYCNSNQCGLFIDNTIFTHPELESKSCIDLGFSCLDTSGKPKCETEY